MTAGLRRDGAPGAVSAWESVLERLRSATVGDYDIGAELGRGGMAAVFLAHDLRLDRKVAIKVMAPGIMLGEGMVERFHQEAVTVANLHHAHIVTIYDVRHFGELNFFVMQYIEGQSLEGVVRATGGLSVDVSRAILYQVGTALAYAHRRGIVHRDIKPANILLSADGDALVTDFGISKAADGPSNTITGMAVGTPAYMSPEQCHAEPLSGASDQYALGVVAYQMLAGTPPFSGTLLTIMEGHTRGVVPSLRAVAPEVPESMELAILRMLEKDPARRFGTIAEALTALGAHPVGEEAATRLALMRLAGSVFEEPSPPTTVPQPPDVSEPPEAGLLSEPPEDRIPSLVVDSIPATLVVGESYMLTAVVEPSALRASFRWHSDTPDVLSVGLRTGVVMARAPGRGVVAVSAGTLTAQVAIHIVALVEHAVLVLPEPPRPSDWSLDTGDDDGQRSGGDWRKFEEPRDVPPPGTPTPPLVAPVAGSVPSRPPKAMLIGLAVLVLGGAAALLSGKIGRSGAGADDTVVAVVPAPGPVIVGPPPPGPEKPDTTRPVLRLEPRISRSQMRPGQFLRLRASLRHGVSGAPFAGQVTFESSDPSIVRVNRRSGEVAALAVGRAQISVTASGALPLRVTVEVSKSAEELVVIDSPPPPPLTLDSRKEDTNPPGLTPPKKVVVQDTPGGSNGAVRAGPDTRIIDRAPELPTPIEVETKAAQIVEEIRKGTLRPGDLRGFFADGDEHRIAPLGEVTSVIEAPPSQVTTIRFEVRVSKFDGGSRSVVRVATVTARLVKKDNVVNVLSVIVGPLRRP